MGAYTKAMIEAAKMMEKHTPVSSDADEVLFHRVASLYEPGVTKAKDIARTLGKSVQQIRRIIEKLTKLTKA